MYRFPIERGRSEAHGRCNPWSVFAMTLLLAACSGQVVGDTNDTDGSGGQSTAQNEGGAGGQSDAEAACKPEAIAARIWALTPAQYAAAMNVVFGFAPSLKDYPAPFVDLRTGFSNSPKQLFYSDQHTNLFFDNAEKAAAALSTKTLANSPCLGDAVPSDVCLTNFLKPLVTLAHRRPADASDLAPLISLWKTTRAADSAGAAIEAVVVSLALSPKFLFRSELGGNGKEALDSFEVASALAFGLTDAPPSQELLDAAAAGKLDSREGRVDAARKLAASGAAAGKMASFIAAQLGLHKLETKRNGTNDDVIASLRQEVNAFVAKIMSSESGSLQELYTANYTMADRNVAGAYGKPQNAVGNAWQVLQLDGAQRAGIFTMPAWLMASTDSIRRGLIIRGSFLCGVIPELPKNAGNLQLQLPKTDPAATAQEKWDVFVKERSGCAACHSVFQPLGFAFENFDKLGGYIDRNELSRPVDGKGTFDDGEWQFDFESAPDLAKKIAGDPRASACFSQRYLGFVMGQLDEQPGCSAKALGRKWKDQNLSLQALVSELAGTDAFVERKPTTSAEGK